MTIKEYLRKYNTNIYQLCMKSGISPSSVTRMLKGQRFTVTPITAAKISSGSGGKITVQEILFPNGDFPDQARMAVPKKRKVTHGQ